MMNTSVKAKLDKHTDGQTNDKNYTVISYDINETEYISKYELKYLISTYEPLHNSFNHPRNHHLEIIRIGQLYHVKKLRQNMYKINMFKMKLLRYIPCTYITDSGSLK